jgi:hypothetical protein
MGRVHGAVPVHARLQPANVLPTAGFGTSATVAVAAKVAEHPTALADPFVMVQLIPVGVEETFPLPFPEPLTISTLPGVAKFTETDLFCDIVTLHAPVPEQSLPQPLNVKPLPTLAVRLTTVFTAYVAEQAPLVELPVMLQLMAPLNPAGAAVTTPLPFPIGVTVSVNDGTITIVTENENGLLSATDELMSTVAV